MKIKLLCSMLAALVGTGLALAQTSNSVPAAASGQRASGQAPAQPAPGGAPRAASPYMPLGQPTPTPADFTPYGYGNNEEDGKVCCPGCKPPPEVCGPTYRAWANVDYLLWWTRNTGFPPLVATAPAASLTVPLAAGATGLPGQLTLFGGGTQDFEARNGMRVNLGWYADADQCWGIDGNLWFFEEKAAGFASTSPGLPVLGRPISDVSSGTSSLPTLVLYAAPAPFNLIGSGFAYAPSNLWGTEANLRWRGPAMFSDRLHLLAGVRHMQLNEGLSFTEVATVDPASGKINAGDTLGRFDSFGTHNQFYAAQFGFDNEWCIGKWVLDIKGKVALGDMHQVVNINGFTSFSQAGQPAILAPGGLLALPSNSGSHSREHFAFMPETTINLGYQLTSAIRAFVGYNYFIVTDVVRPGDQVDTSINTAKAPFLNTPNPGSTVNRPAFGFHGTDFWAQGLNLGINVTY